MKWTLPRRLDGLKKPLRRLRDSARKWSCYGRGRYCPVCGRTSRRFASFGAAARRDARCIHCGALERHRLLWLFLAQRTDLFDGTPKKLLHVAPERCFQARFAECLGDGYVTADLTGSHVRLNMDVANIPCVDQAFDAVYCSHVLEHVPDDKRAMREFCRVMKQGGWAILLVPVDGPTTFEDPTIVTPAERMKFFGQADHVRRYGEDFPGRLREAGFTVEVVSAQALVNDADAVAMGLTPASGVIYYCKKC